MQDLNPLKTYSPHTTRPPATVIMATRSHDTDTRRPVTAKSPAPTGHKSADEHFLLVKESKKKKNTTRHHMVANC